MILPVNKFGFEMPAETGCCCWWWWW